MKYKTGDRINSAALKTLCAKHKLEPYIQTNTGVYAPMDVRRISNFWIFEITFLHAVRDSIHLTVIT